MPKNSRRKKDTRKRAARQRERYMRALRSARASQASPDISPATAEDPYDLSAGLADIHLVQRLVEARGWVVSPFADDQLDANGRARSTEIMWDYAPAFGGIELDDEDEDVVPLKPTCRVSWDGPFGPGWVEISTAGNWGGCAEHRTVRLRVPLTEAGIVGQLPPLLAEVEQPARLLNATPYLECLAAGPCREQWRQRGQRDDKTP